MKKIALIVTILFTAVQTYAQKIGVVDTNYVLSKLPQYKEAQYTGYAMAVRPTKVAGRI